MASVIAATLVWSGPSAGAVTLDATGSVEQVFVLGATPGAEVELRNGADAVIATGTADAQGGFIFRNDPDIVPGPGYTVHQGPDVSNSVTVLDRATHPPQSFYDGQTLEIDSPGCAIPGLNNPCPNSYQYIETRDGTTLSVNVLPPLNPFAGPGPYPVLVNYSGYSPSDPDVLNVEPSMTAARAWGYAVVGVNIRGTGCSGGAYDYWEFLQSLDGYDVIETVAAQSWSAKVGMTGVSFPGISQLFVAQTQPPDLAAIAPMSVIADTYRSTLYPGGILNSGFAVDWASGRENDAKPAASGWVQDRIAEGDVECADNQRLKLQAPPILSRLEDDVFYDSPEVNGSGDPWAPRTFVDQINVPTLLAGAWQDEQVGGQSAALLDDFDLLGGPGEPPLRAEFVNGHHAEAMAPQLMLRAFEFFDLYVADRVPEVPAVVRGLAPAVFQELYGANDIHIPPDRPFPDDLAAARAQYEAEPPIHVWFENGASGTGGAPCPDENSAPTPCPAGYPFAPFDQAFGAWPPPGTTETAFYLQPDGRLSPDAPTIGDDEPRGWSTYAYDGSGGNERNFSGGSPDIWKVQPTYQWQANPEGTSLSFLTDPLTEDLAMVGSASVDLWLRSEAADLDVEVDLTEVRPDGDENYIQSGWLRASHRAEGPESTALEPFQTHFEADAEPLPDGEFASLRVEVFPFAHVARAGSRLRVTVKAPGGNRPLWEFTNVTYPEPQATDIGHSVGRPSRLLLPVQPDVDPPTGLPACNALRGQPCRDFVAGRFPTNVTTTWVGDRLQVDWEAPAAAEVTAAAAVETYEVTVEPAGTVVEVAGSETSHTFPLPVPGEDTWVSVAAVYGVDDAVSGSPSLIGPPDHPFIDVPRDRWYAESVDWIAAYGVASGFPGGEYRPQDAANRGQMASYLWNLVGRPETDFEHSFSDVPAGAWYDDALDWVAEHDIASGFPNGTYRPKDPVNRAQMARMLHNLAGTLTDGLTPNPFSDVPDGIWYEQAVDWLTTFEIATGFPDGTYRPKDPVKRGQLAAWLSGLAADPAAWTPGTYPYA